MGVKVNMLENGEGIEILASDVVTGREIIQAHEKIYDKTHLSNQKYHIIDKSEKPGQRAIISNIPCCKYIRSRFAIRY